MHHLSSLTGAACYAEIGSRIPESGGGYTYLYRTLGAGLGCLSIIRTLLAALPSTLAVVARTTADYTIALAFRDGCGDPPVVLLKLTAILVIRKYKRPRGLDALLGHLLVKRIPVTYQLSSTKSPEYFHGKSKVDTR